MAVAREVRGESQQEMSFTRRGLLSGAGASIPVTFSDAVYGVVFGALAHRVGLSALEAVLMSGLVVAGTAQMVALSMWASPVPVVSLVLTTFIVNLRYLMQGAILHRWVGRLSRLKAYGPMFVLSDENWALSVAAYERGERDASFLLGSGLLLYASWVTSTVVGYVAGAVIKNPAAWGLDFVFLGVLAALLAGRYRDTGDLLPWTMAATAAVVAERVLPGTWYILLGAAAGIAVKVVTDDA